MFGLGIVARWVLAAVVAAVLAAIYWKGLVTGRAQVEARWAIERAAQAEQLAKLTTQLRAREQQLNQNNQAVEVRYVRVKQTVAADRAAVQSELDRLRQQLADRAVPAAGGDASAGTGADEPGLDRLFSACAAELAGVAAAADAVAAQLTGLQDYVRSVCLAAQPTARP